MRSCEIISQRQASLCCIVSKLQRRRAIFFLSPCNSVRTAMDKCASSGYSNGFGARVVAAWIETRSKPTEAEQASFSQLPLGLLALCGFSASATGVVKPNASGNSPCSLVGSAPAVFSLVLFSAIDNFSWQHRFKASPDLILIDLRMTSWHGSTLQRHSDQVQDSQYSQFAQMRIVNPQYTPLLAHCATHAMVTSEEQNREF